MEIIIPVSLFLFFAIALLLYDVLIPDLCYKTLRDKKFLKLSIVLFAIAFTLDFFYDISELQSLFLNFFILFLLVLHLYFYGLVSLHDKLCFYFLAYMQFANMIILLLVALKTGALVFMFALCVYAPAVLFAFFIISRFLFYLCIRTKNRIK